MKVILRLLVVCCAAFLQIGCGADNTVEVPAVIQEQPEEGPTGQATEPTLDDPDPDANK